MTAFDETLTQGVNFIYKCKTGSMKLEKVNRGKKMNRIL